MADPVKIAEIDIGTDKLIKSAGAARQEIESLKKVQRELKKETDNLTTATSKQLKEFTENEVELKTLQKEYRNSIKVLDAYINIQNQEIKTKTQAREANLKLMAISADLDTTNKEQAELQKKINAEIDRNTDFIKENSSEYEKTKINVGNYSEAITDALSKQGIFSEEIRTGKEVMAAAAPVYNALSFEVKSITANMFSAGAGAEVMTKGQKAVAVATNIATGSLKLFRIALISTGIGAIVVLIASLVAYFASTQKGIDAVNSVLTPLKVVFESLLGVLQEVGEALASAFSTDGLEKVANFVKDQLFKRFEGLRKIVEGLFTFNFDKFKEGVAITKEANDVIVDGIKNAGSALADTLKEAYTRGQQIAALTIEIEKAENRLILARAEASRLVKEQNKIAEDITKTDAERQAAAELAIKTSETILKQEQAILDLKIKQKELEQQSNDTSREEEKELNELIAQRTDKETSALELQTTLQNKLNQIRQSSIAASNKARDEAIEKSERLLDIYIAEQGIRKQTLEEELKLAEEVFKREIEIEKKKLKAKKITQEEYKLFVIESENDLAKIRTEILIRNYQDELEAFKDSHQQKIDAEQFFTEQLLQSETERLEAIRAKEQEYFERKLEVGAINQTEYNQALKDVDDEFYAKKQELEAQREAAKKEKAVIDLENQRLLDEERFANEFELERERERIRYEAELAAAEKTGADLTLIKKKHALAQEKIDEALQQSIVASYGATAGVVAGLLGDQSALGKAAALTQALINTYQGITAGVKLGYPAAIPAVAAASATGFQAISKIKGVKAEHGTSFTIGGKRHSQGGTNFYADDGTHFEAEQGERLVILNRRASQELGALSNLNQNYGGVPLTKASNYLASGGTVIRGAGRNQTITVPGFNEEKLAEIMATAVSNKINDIKLVNPVDQITSLQQQQKFIEDGANVGG